MALTYVLRFDFHCYSIKSSSLGVAAHLSWEFSVLVNGEIKLLTWKRKKISISVPQSVMMRVVSQG